MKSSSASFLLDSNFKIAKLAQVLEQKFLKFLVVQFVTFLPISYLLS